MIHTRNQSHHPYVTFLTVMVAIWGLGQLVSETPPESIQETLPPGWQLTWALLMFVGSLLSLFGFVWRDPWTALHIERMGMTMTACGGLAYTVAIFFASPDPLSGLAGWLTAGFVLASAYRAWQITRIMRAVRSFRGGGNG